MGFLRRRRGLRGQWLGGKVSTFDGYQKHGNYWRWGKIHVKNVQTKKESILEWQERDLGVELDEDAFESASLGD